MFRTVLAGFSRQSADDGKQNPCDHRVDHDQCQRDEAERSANDEQDGREHQDKREFQADGHQGAGDQITHGLELLQPGNLAPQRDIHQKVDRKRH